MKKLQNNYTSVEQSKRLLELGVPANSADCFITEINRMYYLGSRTYGEQEKLEKRDGGEPTPCWSVGRLMEIYTICSDLQPTWEYRDGIIDYMIECIAGDLLEQDLYFSRLED